MLSVGLFLAVLYIALPHGPQAGVLYVLATVAAAGAVAGAAWRRTARGSRRAWGFIATALVLATIGHVSGYGLDWGGRQPLYTWADASYLAVYPLFALALIEIGRQRFVVDGALSDALIVGVSGVLVGWALLIRPYIGDAGLTWLQLLVATAYPAAGLILLPFVLRLAFETRARLSMSSFLLAGMLLHILGDMLYIRGNAVGWYTPGGVTDGLWLVAYTLFAAGAWYPRADDAVSKTPGAGTIRPAVRLVALGIASVVLPLLILLMAGRDATTVRVAAAGSILVFALVLWRLGGLVRTASRQRRLLDVLSQTDALTGAANRVYLDQVLEREIARCERNCADLSIAVLDIDHFKAFNDRLGNDSGDRLLIETAQAWRRELRPADVLARIGGEKFVVVLPDSDAHQCQTIVERLRARVTRDQTCSAGIARFQSGDSMQSLIGRAEEAIYRAKCRGRDQAATAVDY